jgi:OOP family OmpA-OmpF porin
MVQKGIAGNHLDVLGKGPDEPVADNTTNDGRARNRRIEFKIQ